MTVQLRRTGVAVLDQIPWGAHICLFYETTQDLLDANVAYFKSGLKDNEYCLWVISDPVTEHDAHEALALAIPDVAKHLADKRIEVLHGRDWYLIGDEFNLRRITDGWDAKLRQALDNGFECMRVSGNAFWLSTDYREDFLAYERELDRSLAGKPMITLCTYSLGATRGMDVLDVALAHNTTIARRNGSWEVVEAFAAGSESDALTARERQVLTWVARGKSAWEIGEILQIAKRTVDEHVQRATRKLGAANRTQATAIAIRDRLIDPAGAE
jgi:DNA-binding CsgD family transcriptional regulator